MFSVSKALGNYRKIISSLSTMSEKTPCFSRLIDQNRTITRHQQIGAEIYNKQYLKMVGKGVAPNILVRDAYVLAEKEIEQILPTKDLEEIAERNRDSALELYAKVAVELRQGMRWQARDRMPNIDEVRNIQARDNEVYGDPDGPSYEWLIQKYTNRAGGGVNIKKMIADTAIYFASQTSNPTYNRASIDPSSVKEKSLSKGVKPS